MRWIGLVEGTITGTGAEEGVGEGTKLLEVGSSSFISSFTTTMAVDEEEGENGFGDVSANQL